MTSGECINCGKKTSRYGNTALSSFDHICIKCHKDPARYVKRDLFGRPVTKNTPKDLIRDD